MFEVDLVTLEVAVKGRFLNSVLGTQGRADVMSEHVARKNGLDGLPEDEELSHDLIDDLDAQTSKFYRDTAGRPCLMDYQIKGFLKAAAGALNGKKVVVDGKAFSLPKNLKSKVNNYVFVTPRWVRLVPPAGVDINALEVLERPLRAGDGDFARVCLAASEMLPEETVFEFRLAVIGNVEITAEVLAVLLAYGESQGLLQWRNAGHGSFTVDSFEVRG